ncbi:MAG: TonB-dependent receptor [Bacteroidota bacterium]|nr:TonB-dependent receptor [Bacteroidota bacterium]
MEKNYYILFTNRFISVCILLWVFSYKIVAQTPTDSTSAKQFPAVDILSKNYKISETGIKTTTPDSALKYINNYKDLADIINLNSTAYIKNYGNGGLATVSFRGTGAEHTNVLWNGFQFNNPALGLTDLSGLASNSNEKITMLAGGNATAAGSGAIGGSVLIDQDYEKKDAINFSGNYNTIGGYTNAFSANMGSDKLVFNLSIVDRENNNNFKYINPFKLGNPLEQMPSVKSSKRTFNGSVLYQFSKNLSFKLLSLYNTYRLEIQAPIGIDIIQGTRDGLNMVNGIHLDFKSNGGITQIKTGLLNQNETYDGRPANYQHSQTNITQWQNTAEHFFNIMKTGKSEHKFSFALEHQFIKGEQTNYNIKRIENRTAVMIRYKLNLKKRFQISANIREQYYSNSKPFFSPFVGLQYILSQKNRYIILLKSNATKGFRLPTFNERYYQPGGNINIKPENTKQVEAGLVYKYCSELFKHDIEITYYYNHIYNRVVWTNLNSPSYPEPINLKETKINGVELVYSITTRCKKIGIRSQLAATYTQSLNISPSLKGRQMIYIPPFKCNWWTEIKYKNTSLVYLLQQIGARYTNLDNTDWLEPYLVQNIYIQQQIKFRKLDLLGSLKFINLGNVYYQTLQNYALPGRYIETSIIINIKQK